MNKLLTVVMVMISLCFSANANQSDKGKPFVIPEIRQWQPMSGEFIPGRKLSIVVSKAGDKELLQVANQFADDLQTMFGMRADILTGSADRGEFALNIGELTNTNPEAYEITTSLHGISIAANKPVGALWATRTLLQIMEQSNTRAIPCGTISDWPEYKLRGFMLDAGRKYFSMDYLQSVVKMMSYYKMNTFQVHLNDNGFKEFFGGDWSKTPAAFRLESTTYPGLAAKDGHYTKDEFRSFQIEANKMGVTVIPEIDAPAHTLAFAHYDPRLGSETYGLDHLDLFNPHTYEFMDGLWKEYIGGDNPVFVGEYVHIGTDEYSNKDQEVVEKFRYFTDRYIKYVESFGKKAALWGALTHAKGDTPVKVDSVLMTCWYNGYAEPRDMIEKGYEIYSAPDGMLYIVPEAGYYHDYLDIKEIYGKWTPAVVGNEVFEERHPKIRGGMFACWNDHCGNGVSYQDVHHRVVPAMQALAVKMWDGKDVKLPFDEFNAQRIKISEAPGMNILARPKGGVTGVIMESPYPQKEYNPVMTDIGFNYRVEFDLKAGKNPKGTVLFESDNSKFYLADPQEGKLGFTRDGYDYRFNYKVPVGKQVDIAVEGTNKSTKLFVNGKLVESLDVIRLRKSLDREDMNMSWVQTLVFPLAKLGAFNGTVSNMRVTAL